MDADAARQIAYLISAVILSFGLGFRAGVAATKRSNKK